MLRPYNLLTDEDKQNFVDFCLDYVNVKINNIDKTLHEWDKNCRNLCKFLGNNLRVSFPIAWRAEKEYFIKQLQNIYTPFHIESELQREYWNPYITDGMFICSLGQYICDNKRINLKTVKIINKLISYDSIYNIYLDSEIKIKYKNKKALILNKGMKIMRAVRKLLEYIDFPHMEDFISWRDEISLLKTDKSINANLVFSINPIDYITMSDNDCNWSSCFSFKNDGGYSSSPIELMNSNMAIICYIESPTKNTMTYGNNIPNKAWRTILYVHKDILLVGKHYHFQSEPLAKIILEKAMELAEQNLGWKYKHQYQQYYDVIHYKNNNYIKDNMKRYRNGHHIYTYSNNYMFNDIIEDRKTKYWCCRNYVKKNLFLNLSGPLTCLSCGEVVNDDCDYDDDFDNSTKICYNCWSNENNCCYCNIIDIEGDAAEVKVLSLNGNIHISRFCTDCLKNKFMYDKVNNVYVKQSDIRLLKQNRPYIVSLNGCDEQRLVEALNNNKSSGYFSNLFSRRPELPHLYYRDIDAIFKDLNISVYRPYFNLYHLGDDILNDITIVPFYNEKKYRLINDEHIDDILTSTETFELVCTDINIEEKYPQYFKVNLVNEVE